MENQMKNPLSHLKDGPRVAAMSEILHRRAALRQGLAFARHRYAAACKFDFEEFGPQPESVLRSGWLALHPSDAEIDQYLLDQARQEDFARVTFYPDGDPDQEQAEATFDTLQAKSREAA